MSPGAVKWTLKPGRMAHFVCSTEPSIAGDIKWPRVEWRAVDPDVVVCVAPAEWEGGVLHDGRPFVP